MMLLPSSSSSALLRTIIKTTICFIIITMLIITIESSVVVQAFSTGTYTIQVDNDYKNHQHQISSYSYSFCRRARQRRRQRQRRRVYLSLSGNNDDEGDQQKVTASVSFSGSGGSSSSIDNNSNNKLLDSVLTLLTSDIGSISLGIVGLIVLILGRLILDSDIDYDDSSDSDVVSGLGQETRSNLLAILAIGSVLVNGISKLDVQSRTAETVDLVGVQLNDPIIADDSYGDTTLLIKWVTNRCWHPQLPQRRLCC